MKSLTRAQRRVLRGLAVAENAAAGLQMAPVHPRWVWRHGGGILRKLIRRGYAEQKVRQIGGGWVIMPFLTEKGWSACGVHREWYEFDEGVGFGW